MQYPRLHHASTLLSDGRVVVAGGALIEDSREVADIGIVEVYETGEGWSRIADMPLYDNDSPQNPTGVVLPNGRLVVGDGLEDRHHGVGALLHVLDPISMTWKNVLIPRGSNTKSMDVQFEMVNSSRGLLLVGGMLAAIPSNQHGASSKEICTVDFELERCDNVASLVVGTGESASLMTDERSLIVIGGFSIEYRVLAPEVVIQRRVEQIDVMTGVVTRRSDTDVYHAPPKGRVISDGLILVVGDVPGDLRIVELYDIARDRWTRELLPTPLREPYLIIAGDGTPFVYSPVSEICCYMRDMASGTWFRIDKPSGMTTIGSAVTMSTGEILVTGVGDVNAAVLSMWEFPEPVASPTVPPTATPDVSGCSSCRTNWLPYLVLRKKQ